MFSSLLDEIIILLLSEWIGSFRHLASLDSALCNYGLRRRYANCLRKSRQMQIEYPLENEKMLAWVQRRNIRVVNGKYDLKKEEHLLSSHQKSSLPHAKPKGKPFSELVELPCVSKSMRRLCLGNMMHPFHFTKSLLWLEETFPCLDQLELKLYYQDILDIPNTTMRSHARYKSPWSSPKGLNFPCLTAIAFHSIHTMYYSQWKSLFAFLATSCTSLTCVSVCECLHVSCDVVFRLLLHSPNVDSLEFLHFSFANNKSLLPSNPALQLLDQHLPGDTIPAEVWDMLFPISAQTFATRLQEFQYNELDHNNNNNNHNNAIATATGSKRRKLKSILFSGFSPPSTSIPAIFTTSSSTAAPPLWLEAALQEWQRRNHCSVIQQYNLAFLSLLLSSTNSNSNSHSVSDCEVQEVVCQGWPATVPALPRTTSLTFSLLHYLSLQHLPSLTDSDCQVLARGPLHCLTKLTLCYCPGLSTGGYLHLLAPLRTPSLKSIKLVLSPGITGNDPPTVDTGKLLDNIFTPCGARRCIEEVEFIGLHCQSAGAGPECEVWTLPPCTSLVVPALRKVCILNQRIAWQTVQAVLQGGNQSLQRVAVNRCFFSTSSLNSSEVVQGVVARWCTQLRDYYIYG